AHAPFEEFLISHSSLKRRPAGDARWHLLGDLHETIGIGEGKRLQQDGVDDAVDCGSGADPERERQHGGGCKTGRPPQRADRIAEVVDDAGPSHRVLLCGHRNSFGATSDKYSRQFSQVCPPGVSRVSIFTPWVLNLSITARPFARAMSVSPQ